MVLGQSDGCGSFIDALVAFHVCIVYPIADTQSVAWTPVTRPDDPTLPLVTSIGPRPVPGKEFPWGETLIVMRSDLIFG
jgi:hypothetical protein